MEGGASFLKRGIALLSAVLCVLCLSGCQPKKSASQEWDSRSLWVKNTSSDQGFYFMGENILRFFDPASRKTAVLCGKTGCSHSDDTCEAYLSTSDPLFFRGGKLYYIQFGDNGNELMRRDTDGRNLETVFAFFRNETEDGQSSWQFSDYKMSERYFYYLALKNDAPTESAEDNWSEYSLRRVDVEQGTEEELLRIETSSCSLVAANDRQLIFSQTEIDPSFSYENYDQEELKKLRESSYTKVYLWEEGTENPKLLVEGSRKELYGALAAADDSLLLLYYQDGASGQTLQRMNLQSGEMEELISFPEEVVSYSVLEDGCITMNFDEERRLFRYSGTEFEELSSDFLPEKENILDLEATPEGYVVNRITEKTEISPGVYQTKSVAYSFISKEDAAQGRKNYTDFYTETFE